MLEARPQAEMLEALQGEKERERKRLDRKISRHTFRSPLRMSCLNACFEDTCAELQRGQHNSKGALSAQVCVWTTLRAETQACFTLMGGREQMKTLLKEACCLKVRTRLLP